MFLDRALPRRNRRDGQRLLVLHQLLLVQLLRIELVLRVQIPMLRMQLLIQLLFQRLQLQLLMQLLLLMLLMLSLLPTLGDLHEFYNLHGDVIDACRGLIDGGRHHLRPHSVMAMHLSSRLCKLMVWNITYRRPSPGSFSDQPPRLVESAVVCKTGEGPLPSLE